MANGSGLNLGHVALFGIVGLLGFHIANHHCKKRMHHMFWRMHHHPWGGHHGHWGHHGHGGHHGMWHHGGCR